MGVRVPQTSTSIDNYQVKDAWTESDDTRLRILATSLRENWNLIRLAIIDRHQIGNDYLNYPIRSARQCEEKWHIQQPPSCDERMKKIYQANVTSDCNDNGHIDSSPLSKSLLSASVTPISHNQRVHVLMKANLKRRRMQISLPGPSSNGTSASIPIINPHPSHNQSVHDAVGPIGGQIRSEMWPLQFLESIDKQHQSATIPSTSLSHQTPPAASTGSFHPQHNKHINNTNTKASSTSPVTNHNTIPLVYSPPGAQNWTANKGPTANSSSHTQFPNYGPRY